MWKKFTAFLCILSFLTIPQFAVSATDTDSAKREILQGLGIVSETKVNKGIFVKSLAGFLYEDASSYTAEWIAKDTGIISSAESFKANDSLTVDEALSYAVVALGYKYKAESENGYATVAAQIGLTKGVTDNGNKRLNYDTAVQILYNMLEIAPMQKVIDGTGITYRVNSNTTLLEQNRDIYKIYGIVTANTKTTLYSDAGKIGSRYAEIDGVRYRVGEMNIDELLGYSVVAYVKETDETEMEIVYMCERNGKNDVLEIADKDIKSVAGDFSYIEYSEGKRAKKVKIDNTVSVIYNGVSYGGYTADDLMPDVGGLFMIDNDGDGKYDVVKVTSYETMVISYTDGDKNIIGNKYAFSGSIPELSLKNSDDKDVIIYAADGTQTSKSTLAVGNIISIAQSKDGSVVRIYISGDEGKTGKLTSINYDDSEIMINGKAYRVSEAFWSYINDISKDLEIGKNYTFHLDYFGNVAYVENAFGTDYVVFRKVYNNDDNYYVSYMDFDGEWHMTPLKSKVTLDDVKVDAEFAYDTLKTLEPQVVKITVNLSGEIKMIDLAELSDAYKEDKFTVTSETNYTYRSGPGSLGMILYPNSDAVVVSIPSDVGDKESYKVKVYNGYFASDKQYKISAYDVDKYGRVSIMMIKESTETKKNLVSKSMFVVTGFSNRLVDGEVLPVISGYTGVYENITVIGNTPDVFGNIKRGDVINLSTNSKGRVDYVEKISTATTTNYYDTGSSIFIDAKVLSVDHEGQMIQFQNGSTVSNMRLSASTAMICYERATNTCRTEQVTALKAGDSLMMRISYGQIIEMVCFE